VHLIVTSKKSSASVNYWLPEIPGIAENASSPYTLEPKDLKTGVFTGLEVSHEPGQWSVWGGVVLMAIGLTFVFYVIHMRFWIVPVQDGHVYARSNDVVNPAVHLILTSKKANASVNYWLPEIPDIAENASSPYTLQPKDLKTGVFTGLEVSHEPGQWSVWGGVVLMAIGLTFVFYVIHMRFWIVPVHDAGGRLALWIGGSANRNRDAFEMKFKKIVKEIQKELKPAVAAAIERPAASISGR